jgi:hypothetical protein
MIMELPPSDVQMLYVFSRYWHKYPYCGINPLNEYSIQIRIILKGPSSYIVSHDCQMIQKESKPSVVLN